MNEKDLLIMEKINILEQRKIRSDNDRERFSDNKEGFLHNVRSYIITRE